MELRGTIETGKGGEVYLVVNPKCKCRRSYLILPKEVAEGLKKKESLSEITVLGWLLRTSPWSGYIYVNHWWEEE